MDERRTIYMSVEAVADWLRDDEAEAIRADAIRRDVPPEDALAHALEVRYGTA
jgi:hypothetical protein